MTLEGDAQSLENSLASICDLSSTTTVKRNPNTSGVELTPAQSKYGQLLSVIEEMGKDIRISYAGNKASTEKLKRGIVQANKLLRECLIETERSARM